MPQLDVKVRNDQYPPRSEVYPSQGAFRLFAARRRAADRQDRQACRCVRDAGHRALRHEQPVRHSRVLGEAFRRGHPAHRRHDARHRLPRRERRRPPRCGGRDQGRARRRNPKLTVWHPYAKAKDQAVVSDVTIAPGATPRHRRPRRHGAASTEDRRDMFKRLSTELALIYAALFGAVLLLIAGAVWLAVENNSREAVQGGDDGLLRRVRPAVEAARRPAVADRRRACPRLRLPRGRRDRRTRRRSLSALDNLQSRSGFDTAFIVDPDGRVVCDGRRAGRRRRSRPCSTPSPATRTLAAC